MNSINVKFGRYENAQNLKCFACNKKLSLILPYETGINDYEPEFIEHLNNGNIIDNEDDVLNYCASTENFYYVCINCSYHSLCCTDCSISNKSIQLCRFLGHQGFFVDEEKKYIRKFRTTNNIFNKIIKNENINMSDANDLKNKMENLNINAAKILALDMKNNIENIPYYIGDMNLEYFDTSNVWATGPDGGYYHYWECPSCKKTFSLTDK